MDNNITAFLDYLLDKPDGRYRIIKDGYRFLVIMPTEDGEEQVMEYVKEEPHG